MRPNKYDFSIGDVKLGTLREKVKIVSPWVMRQMFPLRRTAPQSSRDQFLSFFPLSFVFRCSSCLYSVQKLSLQERYNDSLQTALQRPGVSCVSSWQTRLHQLQFSCNWSRCPHRWPLRQMQHIAIPDMPPPQTKVSTSRISIVWAIDLCQGIFCCCLSHILNGFAINYK